MKLIDVTYATTVTHVRVYKARGEWYLDAADDAHWCSEACVTRDSWAEAMAAIPQFIIDLVRSGVKWRGR